MHTCQIGSIDAAPWDRLTRPALRQWECFGVDKTTFLLPFINSLFPFIHSLFIGVTTLPFGSMATILSATIWCWRWSAWILFFSIAGLLLPLDQNHLYSSILLGVNSISPDWNSKGEPKWECSPTAESYSRSASLGSSRLKLATILSALAAVLLICSLKVNFLLNHNPKYFRAVRSLIFSPLGERRGEGTEQTTARKQHCFHLCSC